MIDLTVDNLLINSRSSSHKQRKAENLHDYETGNCECLKFLPEQKSSKMMINLLLIDLFDKLEPLNVLLFCLKNYENSCRLINQLIDQSTCNDSNSV